ncbi:MAG TPA: sialate O-acetylesterase [Prosthecobacter sp.]|nr:sialate O-acetylesterase [Prosthecobacter sp.]
MKKHFLPCLLLLTGLVHAGPVKVFILAGQSNMEGQAVVDLKGKDYNEGRGTLVKLMQDPAKAPMFARLKDSDGQWVVRDDVFVRYQREDRPLLTGPLTLGFSVYGDVHHFGPELQFGHVIGDALENPVLLVKTAWGGKSLYRDFRPPTAGEEEGKYYFLMLDEVRKAIARIGTDFPTLKGRTTELAGLVWYQGWNDGVHPKTAVPEYEQNLVHLIQCVRRDLQEPKLPVVIGELTGPWVKAPPEWEQLRAAQAAVAEHAELGGNVVFVPTRDFVRKADDSPNTGHGHHEFGNAETCFLVGDALGKGMLSLLTGDLHLTSPLDYQVIQRASKSSGNIPIAGKSTATAIEARIGMTGDWKKLDAHFEKGVFHATLKAPAGGWHRLEVRALKDGKVVGETSVAHVGIGEVFVVAGQSNSANHGQEKQTTQTGRVASFDGQRWQLANDPQPGASGRGGSFMPPLGDALVQKFNVPVGFIPCGIGATSVREWLPKGATFPNPPTIESRVQKRPDGTWESKGAAYDAFVARMKSLGPHGFRAVLWHQGESDANQKDPTRTLPGKLYREHLVRVIRDSRRDIGWEAPWFVAQVSYHVPGDEASPDIRDAQASLWKDGIAFEGPDSDALKGELRERNGQGVHFSGPGLREHAAKWAEKLVPWIETK